MMTMSHGQLMQNSNSPPDTTTHSPQSPDRPLSEKSHSSNDSINMVKIINKWKVFSKFF